MDLVADRTLADVPDDQPLDGGQGHLEAGAQAPVRAVHVQPPVLHDDPIRAPAHQQGDVRGGEADQRQPAEARHDPGPPRGKTQDDGEQAGDGDEAGQEGAQAPQANEHVPSRPNLVAEVWFSGAGWRERLRRPPALRRPHRPRDQDEEQADDGEEGGTAPALREGIEARFAGLVRPVQHPDPLPDPEPGGAEPEGALAAEALAPDVVLDDLVVSHAVLGVPALQGHDGAFRPLRPPPPDGGVEASDGRTQEQSAAYQREQAAAAKRVGVLPTDQRPFVHGSPLWQPAKAWSRAGTSWNL